MKILALIGILCLFSLRYIESKVSKMEKKHKEDMELIKGMLEELKNVSVKQ